MACEEPAETGRDGLRPFQKEGDPQARFVGLYAWGDGLRTLSRREAVVNAAGYSKRILGYPLIRSFEALA